MTYVRHYYSFIKDRGSNRWFEFNDSLVREFNLDDLDEETFGGVRSSHGPTGGRSSQSIKNAFMVIYDRIQGFSPSNQTSINEDLMKMVHGSNLKFWKEKLIYNSEFFDFMKSLLSLPAMTENQRKINAFNCGLNFFFSILVQSGERDRLSKWSNHLATMIQSEATLGKVVLECFIEEINAAVREKVLLKESSHTAVMRLLVTSIETTKEDPNYIRELRSLSFKLSNILLEIIETVSNAGKNNVASTICSLPYLLYPLKSVVITQREVSTLLLRRKTPIMLLKLLAFDSISVDDYSKANNELYVANSIQTGLIVALSSMLRELHYLQSNGTEAPFLHEVSAIASTAAFTCSIVAQIKAVYGIKFAGSRACAMEKLFDIVRFVVWKSFPLTEICLRHLLHLINGIDGPDLKDAFRFAGMLMKVDDQLTVERVNLIMTNLMTVMESNGRFSTATEISIDMCLRIMRTNVLARKWLVENWTRCSWMEGWLEKRKSGFAPGSATSKFVQIKKITYPSVISLNKRNMDISCNGFSSSPAIMLSVLRRFRVEEELNDNFYDSDDDPVTLLGKRVEVKWAYNHYYTGDVAEYTFFDDEMEASFEYSADGLHRVVYDDGDVKWHNLALKTWRFV